MSEPSSSSDEIEKWIDLARAGSDEHLGKIAATYRNYLLLIANKELDAQLQGKVGPSDIVQETLIQLQDKFDQFRGQSEEQLLGWLRQILRNQLIDTTRHYKQTNKRQIERERRIESKDDSKGANIQLAAMDKSPRAETIAREESAALMRALDRLPEDYRRVIVLRSLERLPFSEVGEKTGRSAAAAGKLWARAIERLQEELEGLQDHSH